MHNLTFTVAQLMYSDVDILSVFKNKVLVGSSSFSHLFIYSHDGHHLSNITINDNYKLQDAMWTPHGSIVYTTMFKHDVVAMSESGKVIATYTQMTFPQLLSVSNDNIIYLADYRYTVYQSTDDGVSWSVVFKSTERWEYKQVIKVTTDHSDDFWTLSLGNSYHLRVYSLDRRRLNGKVTWKNVNVSTTDGEYIRLAPYSALLYDGKMNIFLSDRFVQAVHVLSVTGQCHWQLLSSHQIKNRPYRLAIDKERQLLYVGQKWSVVKVFQLKYRNEG